jgi:hypothetical protein
MSSRIFRRKWASSSTETLRAPRWHPKPPVPAAGQQRLLLARRSTSARLPSQRKRSGRAPARMLSARLPASRRAALSARVSRRRAALSARVSRRRALLRKPLGRPRIPVRAAAGRPRHRSWCPSCGRWKAWAFPAPDPPSRPTRRRTCALSRRYYFPARMLPAGPGSCPRSTPWTPRASPRQVSPS